jgi:hypothetical protein
MKGRLTHYIIASSQMRFQSSHGKLWTLLLLVCGAVCIVNLWLVERKENDPTLVSASRRIPVSDFIFTSQRHGFKERPFGDSSCWSSWHDFQKETKKFQTSLWSMDSSSSSSSSSFPNEDPTVVWTVSGGTEYRNSMEMLLTGWKEMYRKEPVVLVVVALDLPTYETACGIDGVSSILWDLPAQSYSRVADAKMGVAAYLSQQGFFQLFIELDVFCRVSPLLLCTRSLVQFDSADLAVPGHADFQSKINIGLYYVRPSSKATEFFTTLIEILRMSLTEEQYMTRDGTKLPYFDQGIFQMCLQMSQTPMEMYALSDTGYTRNFLEPCNNHNLQYSLISNFYISSYKPPTVYDSTICVHPLNNQPFSSFETKRATAKFLGFDPIHALRDESRPLLKTLSGDLSITDSPDSASFFGGNFHKLPVLQRAVQYPLAAMIHFAILTNRTLVLPRHVRNTNTKAFPLFSLVNTASIEAMGVSWRYLTVDEARQLETDTTIVTIQQQLTLKDAASAILHVCSISSITDRRTSNDPVKQVCAIHGLETLISSLDLETQGTGQWKQILEPIVGNLTWCLSPPSGSLFSFSIGAGHMDRPCTG